MARQPAAKRPTKAKSPRPRVARKARQASAPDEQAAIRNRFVVANLISHLEPGDARNEGLDQFRESLRKSILPNADLVSARRIGKGKNSERHVAVIDIDPAELAAKMAEMPHNSVAERELIRSPALAYPYALMPTRVAGPEAPGTGSLLALQLVGSGNDAVAGAKVYVSFHSWTDPSASVTAGGVSDADGKVAVPFDPRAWWPALVAVEPSGRYWTLVADRPQTGQILRMQELGEGGPIRWWHLVSGVSAYGAEAGSGLRVGIIDTGVGPHPAVAHVRRLGAFTNGTFAAGDAAAADAQTHGTHVSGILGARVEDGGTAPGGVAPGADLLMVRIFGPEGGGNQGDVAGAIDLLALDNEVDIINLSLTGDPSAIEHDAVIAAYRRGTVCVCAAGNQSGSAVGAPALYPESIAVSALGLLGGGPAGTMAAYNVPTQPDRFAPGGLFLASFSNVGPQLFCTAPGNGIISTIPAVPGDAAPYGDMSGTSMASPMVAGLLAAILSGDAEYLALPRGLERSTAARAKLTAHCQTLGLNPLYQGLGISRRG